MSGNNSGRRFNPVTEVVIPFLLIGSLSLITMITTMANKKNEPVDDENVTEDKLEEDQEDEGDKAGTID